MLHYDRLVDQADVLYHHDARHQVLEDDFQTVPKQFPEHDVCRSYRQEHFALQSCVIFQLEVMA